MFADLVLILSLRDGKLWECYTLTIQKPTRVSIGNQKFGSNYIELVTLHIKQIISCHWIFKVIFKAKIILEKVLTWRAPKHACVSKIFSLLTSG